jgi:hypothetical protein
MTKKANEVNQEVEVQEVQTNKMVMVADDSLGLMEGVNLGSFYSINPQTKEEKVAVFNALNNPDERLADHINNTIDVKDVLVEIVELVQDATGELVKAPRIIMIDDKGKSYQCVSVGVFSALKKLFMLFGTPTWEDPLKIKVKQVSKKEKKMLTIELA